MSSERPGDFVPQDQGLCPHKNIPASCSVCSAMTAEGEHAESEPSVEHVPDEPAHDDTAESTQKPLDVSDWRERAHELTTRPELWETKTEVMHVRRDMMNQVRAGFQDFYDGRMGPTSILHDLLSSSELEELVQKRSELDRSTFLQYAHRQHGRNLNDWTYQQAITAVDTGVSNRFTWDTVTRSMNDLMAVGTDKLVGYLPLKTLDVYRQDPEQVREELMRRGLTVAVHRGHLYAYDRPALATLLQANESIVRSARWPTDPDAFVKNLNRKLAPLGSPLFRLIADAFGDVSPRELPEHP